VGELLAFLRQPEPPRGLKDAMGHAAAGRTVMSMRPHGPQDRAGAGGGLEGRRHRPDEAADPGLLARRARAADHLAAGGHQGPERDREDDYNLGIYRMQVLGKDRTIMRWLAHRGGAQHHRRWKAQGKREPLPACAVIGADPGTILAAVTPVPDTLSEYQFAGLLRGAKLDLVPAKTVPADGPGPGRDRAGGPRPAGRVRRRGARTATTPATTTPSRQFPVFQVSAITMRKDPIYLTTFTGRPPDEPSVLGEALNEVFIPLLQQQFPEIVDFWLPPEGCSYRIAVVSMKKAYAGHAKRVMMGVWSYLRQFMYTKWVIVVDADIDARDWKDVMWAISTRMDPAATSR
jgi:4-hydroxy-3-polyprenylbenzoate decarboxylase